LEDYQIGRLAPPNFVGMQGRVFALDLPRLCFAIGRPASMFRENFMWYAPFVRFVVVLALLFALSPVETGRAAASASPEGMWTLVIPEAYRGIVFQWKRGGSVRPAHRFKER
jgi:hypothetical protein